jgi:ribosomal protein L4
MSVVHQVHLELAAASEQQTASDKGENPHNHGGSHTAPQSGAMDALLRCDTKKVMHGMSKVQCGEQDGNST